LDFKFYFKKYYQQQDRLLCALQPSAEISISSMNSEPNVRSQKILDPLWSSFDGQ